MRLSELSPLWLEHGGQRIAIMFLCPHCFPSKRQWLTCFFSPAGNLPPGPDDERGERVLFKEAFIKMGVENPEKEAWEVVGCQPGIAWNRVGDDFETMTITPSLDSSPAGHWHGFITNGNIT